MITKQNKKLDRIILFITSFNQLNNFLSFFLEKNLIGKTKIYLIILSDTIPEQLILHFREYIQKFATVEVVDMRRKSIQFKKNFFNTRLFHIFFYYFFVLKKILQIKKLYVIPYIITYSKIQFTTLFFMIFFSSSKIFFIEDGMGDYISHRANKKLFASIFLKTFLMLNKSRIYILQLARTRKDYFGLLNQPYLKKINYFDNRKVYKKFTENSLDKKLFFKPKCILIGTKHLPHTFNYYKSLYINTLLEINKKYSYSPEQILFLPHPRDESVYIEELKKKLVNYSKISTISSIVVENYFFQENLEVIIGTPSSALYYAKSIFNKDQLFYIDHDVTLNIKNESYNNYINVFKSIGVKKFFD